MGTRGAIIMGFFGAVFAAFTLYHHGLATGGAVFAPFAGFVAVALTAALVVRQPGVGIVPSAAEARALRWSTIGEGIGLLLAGNLVVNLHRPDWLLPAMALVVGLHFLPVALVGRFRPFLVLGLALVAAAVAGVAIGGRTGGAISGAAACGALWIAAGLAIRRDWRAKRGSAA